MQLWCAGILGFVDGLMAGGGVEAWLWGVAGKGRRMTAARQMEVAAKEGAIRH